SRSSEPVTVSWPRDRTSSSPSATATRSPSNRRRGSPSASTDRRRSPFTESTSSWSARPLRTSGSCAVPNHTRARVCATPAKSSVARSERLVSKDGLWQKGKLRQGQGSCSQASSRSSAQARERNGRAPSPLSDSLHAPRLRPGHRRHRRRDPGLGLHHGSRSADTRRREDRQGPQGGRAGGPACQGCRCRSRRLRPWRQRLPRPCAGNRRRCPRRRIGPMSTEENKEQQATAETRNDNSGDRSSRGRGQGGQGGQGRGRGEGRGRGGRGDRDDKNQFIEHVVTINRVSKVVKGGRRFSFTALVVVGDGDGMVGMGYGKAKEVPAAIAKGVEEAKKNFFRVPRIQKTIPHPVQGEEAAGVVLLRPAAPGTGVIAGGPVRAVLDAAGVQDVLSKSLGSSNAINIVHAAI